MKQILDTKFNLELGDLGLTIDDKKMLKKEMMQNSDVLEFLNGLVTTSDHGRPMYMANINLTLKDIDPSTRLKYYKYLSLY